MTNAATSRLRYGTVLLVVMSLAVMAAIAPATQAASSRPPAIASLTRQSASVPAGAETECLTNDSGLCISQEVVVITERVLADIASVGGTVGVVVYIVKKFLGWWNNPGNGKHTSGKDTKLWQGYLEYDGDVAGAAPNT